MIAYYSSTCLSYCCIVVLTIIFIKKYSHPVLTIVIQEKVSFVNSKLSSTSLSCSSRKTDDSCQSKKTLSAIAHELSLSSKPRNSTFSATATARMAKME